MNPKSPSANISGGGYIRGKKNRKRVRRDGASNSSAGTQTGIVDASAWLRIRTRCYRIPVTISLPAASRNPRIHSRARRIQAAETTTGYLAQSAHDRSMSPLFPPRRRVAPWMYCHYRTPVHPVTPLPCYPHHAVVCTARCQLPRCSPFLRTPLSSLPRLLARPTRAFAPVKEKTGAVQEEQEARGGSEERGG